MIIYKQGCAIAALESGEINILAHGVNAKGAMNSGIAKLIRQAYPEVYTKYKNLYDEGGISLGVCQTVVLSKRKVVANLVTQQSYGRDTKRYVNYGAISMALHRLFFLAQYNGYVVGMPRIGAGLGGGSWLIISELVEFYANHFNVEVRVYEI